MRSRPGQRSVEVWLSDAEHAALTRAAEDLQVSLAVLARARLVHSSPGSDDAATTFAAEVAAKMQDARSRAGKASAASRAMKHTKINLRPLAK
jgi:hypothetical protein